jgi:Protein of unknown function (DUF4232)
MRSGAAPVPASRPKVQVSSLVTGGPGRYGRAVIGRTGAAVLVLCTALAGCTGSDPASSAATGSPSEASVTVTATVTAPPPSSGPSPTGSATPAPTGPARCDAPALTVGLGETQGAAGTRFTTVVFRNGGEQPCFLRGFPGASAADAAGKAVVDAVRDTSRAAARVVIEPGRAAHAVLAVRNVPPDAKPCPTYPTLLVTPPDSRRTQTVTVDLTVCAKRMRVSVVLPGAG